MTSIEIASQVQTISTLPSLVDRAAKALQGARSSAEVLEARDLANAAYDAAKFVGRLAKARKAYDELIAAAHRAQADALEIEAGAKRRLADEYDAAQQRGEIAGQGKPSTVEGLATVTDAGLTHKVIHEARTIRNAEVAFPGIVRRTLDDALAAGEEPTKAKVRKATTEAAKTKDAENEASAAAARKALSPAVKAALAAKEERQLRGKKSNETDDLVAEMQNIIEDKDVEIADLRVKVGALEPMRLEYERGGFAEVIKNMGEQIRVLKTRVETESQEKVKNLNLADYWRKKAIKLGWSSDTFIDIETGQEVPSNG